MKSLASLALLLAAPASAIGQQPPPGDGPRGSSQHAASFDTVGYADVDARPGPVAAVRGLTAGATVEVTALDTGRTVLVMAQGDTPPGWLASLSTDVSRQLGLANGGAVRVRTLTASTQDAALLRHGTPAGARLDAPPSLLVALRRMLPPGGAPKHVGQPPMRPVATRPVATQPAPTPAIPSRRTGAMAAPIVTAVPASATPAVPSAPQPTGFWVQVATLSSAENARALADRVGGIVQPMGALHRVRIGPLPDRDAAERARRQVAAQGYSQATITSR